MADSRAIPIGGERFSGKETKAVNSPYDGKELAQIPVCEPGVDVLIQPSAAGECRTHRPRTIGSIWLGPRRQLSELDPPA